MEVPNSILKKKLLEFLEEDIGFGDLTSNLLIPDSMKVKACVFSRTKGIIAGVKEATILCELMDIEYTVLVNDGSEIRENSKIILLEGKAKSILTVERTLLNILMRMSGIATLTNQLVEKVKSVNDKVKIACTRKTTPGFRYFEKRAVIIGGGDSHRYRLDDMILIKDNHLFCIKNLERAIKDLKNKLSFSKKIELEVKTKEEAINGAKFGVDILMLDNFSPDDAKSVIHELQKYGLRENLILEISGNITPQNIQEYAELDVDIISLGYLTHSSKALNLSLDITEIL